MDAQPPTHFITKHIILLGSGNTSHTDKINSSGHRNGPSPGERRRSRLNHVEEKIVLPSVPQQGKERNMYLTVLERLDDTPQ